MNRSSLSRLLAALSLLAPIALAHAQTPGSLDPAYQNPATSEPADVVIAQTVNGVTKAILGGSFDSLLDAARTPVPGFARFNADGSLDSAFLSNITGTTVYSVTALALQPDGKILVAGFDSSVSTGQGRELLRFNADGTPDSAFRVTVDDNIESITFQPGGNILISGLFQTVNGVGNQRCLARLSPAGVLDTTFQAYTNNALTIMEVKRIAVLPGGGVLAVTHVSEGFVDYLIQLSGTDGSVPDAPPFFDLINDGRIYDMTVDSAGNVVVVGNFGGINNHPRDYPVARFAANGQLDLNFVGGPPLASVLLQSVVVDASGRPIVGGVSFFTPVLFRLTADIGIVDSTLSFPLGNDGNFIQSLALEPSANGAVLAAGQYAIGQRAANLVRVILGAGTTTSGSVTVAVPGTSNIWLAGAAAGTTASTGQDTLSNATPFLVSGLTIAPGVALNFTATGNVTSDPAFSNTSGPDGAETSNHMVENGVGAITAPLESLIGVFLDASTPTGATPDALDFSGAAKDYATLAPALRQPFLIGDGKTTAGIAQSVTVPAGATRLYLGSVDPSDQENNLGLFQVAITTGTGTAPPPATGAVLSIVAGLDTTTSDDNGLTAIPGDTLRVKYTLRNSGKTAATGVTIVSGFINGTKFKSADNGGALDPNNASALIIPKFDLAAGEDRTFNIKAKIPSAYSAGLPVGYFIRSITADAPTLAVTGLDQVNAGITPLFVAPYKTSVTFNASPTVGGLITFNLTTTNLSGAAISGVTSSIHIPTGTAFVGGAFGSGAAFAGKADKSGNVTFTLPDLAPGATVTYSLSVRISFDVSPGSTIALDGTVLSIGGTTYPEAGASVVLATAPPTQLPSLALSKLIPDGVTLSTLFGFGPKLAVQLQSAFPFKIVKTDASGAILKDDSGNPVLDFVAINTLGSFLNPNVGQNPDQAADSTLPFYTVAGVSSKVQTPYVTFALLLSNEGDAPAQDVSISDVVPAGFDFNPTGDGVTAHQDLVLINGKLADPSTFKYKKSTRVLTFSLAGQKVKSDKPALVVYQVNVLPSASGGPVPGSTVPTLGASFMSSSFAGVPITASSDGPPVVVVTPIHIYLESKKPLGKSAQVEATTLIDIFYKNDGGQKSSDFRIISLLPKGASFVGAGLLDANEKPRIGSGLDGEFVISPGSPGGTAGQVLFKLGKLKPGKSGYVQVEYKLEDSIVDNSLIVAHQAYVPAISYAGQLVPGTSRASDAITRSWAETRDDNAPASGGATTNSATVATDPNLPRLFVGIIAPAIAHEGDTFDYLLYLANPTNTTAQGPNLVMDLPPQVDLAAPLSDNGALFTSTPASGDIIRTVIFPTANATGDLYPILPHTALVRKLTVKLKTGLGNASVVVSARSESGFGSINNINGKQVPIRSYALPKYRSGSTSTLTTNATASFSLLANQAVTAGLTTVGGGSGLLPDTGLFLTSGTANITSGGPDSLSLNNGVVIIPLGAGNVVAMGPSSNLVAQGGGNLVAQGGGNLVAQGGGNFVASSSGNLVAQGGGNLFGVANLVSSSGSPLITQDGGGLLPNGASISGILSTLVAQGGGNLVAQGGGNIMRGGGGNLISQDGGGLIGNDGGGLVAINPSALLASKGAAAVAGASYLVAQGGGNLVAQGGGNLVAQGGGNLVAQGGGNLVAQGGGNILIGGGGNLMSATGQLLGTSDASLVVHSTSNGLVAQGGGNLITQDGGGLVAQGGGNVHPNEPPTRK